MTAADIDGSNTASVDGPDDLVARRISEWQTRLLQLDRRNNLLYFKPGRSVVEIIEISPDQLRRRLERSRRGLAFTWAESPRRRRRDVGQGIDGSDASAAHEGPRMVEGDLHTDCEPVDLQRRLRNLYRRDREWHEEQGLNILFLAAGFLDWVDSDGEPARSPLLLIPCDLERDSPRDPYRLQLEDDDPVLNPTLLHQLAEIGIKLPEFADESSEDGASVEAYIAEVGRIVDQRPGWAVDAKLVLGGFTFSKLAMYEDLARMRERGVQSDLTLQLAGGADLMDGSAVPPATPSTSDLAGGRLDELLDVRDQHAVLLADFSQLLAIQQARSGANLVIHGPPGTGKSQTIANLIATLLADGKRVLFVSEKMAALDVVKRRLEQCGLGAFCLDLHSDRGRKREVYDQLRTALGDDRERVAPDVSLDELIDSRNHLNRVVQQLHRRREPTGWSVYQVQGLFASLQTLPRCEQIDVPSAIRLEQDWLRETVRRSEGIARRPTEFDKHNTSRWLPLRIPQSPLQLAELVREDLATVHPAVAALRDAAAPHAAWLGFPEVQSADDTTRIVRMTGLLGEAPTVPSAWLARGVVPRLRLQAKAQADQQRHRRRLEQGLGEWLGKEPASLDFPAISSDIQLSTAEQEAIAAAVGPGWRRILGSDPAALLLAAKTFATAAETLVDNASTTGQLLGSEAPQTLAQVEQADSLAERMLNLDPVPERWLNEGENKTLERESVRARALLDDLLQAEKRLQEQFADALPDLVDEDMLIRYRTDHQSLWRRMLGGSFRRDQRVLRGQLNVPAKLTLNEALAAVEQALEVRRLREHWSEAAEELEQALGRRFDGRETDWDRVTADLVAARSMEVEWRGERSVLRDLLADGPDGQRRRNLAELRPQLSEAVRRFRQEGEDFGDGGLFKRAREIAGVTETLRPALGTLRRVADGTEAIYARLIKPITNYDQLDQLVEDGVQLLKVIEEDERLEAELAADFGSHFGGGATDWDAVGRTLDWTEQFLDASGKRPSDALGRHATEPQPSSEYARREQDLLEALQTFRQRLRRLDARFDRSRTAWRTWDTAGFEELESWAADLVAHADEAAPWAEYREAVLALDEQLGNGAVTAIRARTERASEVPGIVRRRVYSSWLEQIYSDEPELREFTRVDHEEIRNRFKKLDRALPDAARQRVRERVFARYPQRDATPLQAGQLATLNGQLSRRRGQMTVRRLIERIPNLLLTLKPCFLMSPLAVSQYLSGGLLESERSQFDTVIFDEASQVWPEDALPAIERARQVIVAGDRHQLPPSDFFRSTGTDDDDGQAEDDGADDAIAGRESVLDVMVGQLGNNVAESWLGVHYRSRCESLIRFSNHSFYDNRLLTFPGPIPDEVCVKSVYLEEATYDAGGSRSNRGEAERVTELVLELMQTTPSTESVGVVALSRAQADLIENLIEERRMVERHLDDRFSADLDECFFVKNLENVQGDERDHMILSIGYGPTPAGAVPNRFGPINREGGERRLNVAVTRARTSMTVVHSIRPEQITSQAAGARQLRRYLEYVRNPAVAFEAEVSGTGEPESPFEEAVLAALRSRGHRVESQVGVSGYRIDLAIHSDDGDGFDLGIECDGATYHSSPAARDRDWLRQQVLEGLGWRIHRVWSTSWIRSPETELAAIEDELDLARSRPPHRSGAAPEPPEHASDERPEQAEPHDADRPEDGPPEQSATLFDEYRRFDRHTSIEDPMSIPTHFLARLIERIVEIEQPVHFEVVVERLRTALGIRRVGSNIRKRFVGARSQATRDGAVTSDPQQFLRITGSADKSVPRRDPDRRIGLISDEELDDGLLFVTRATFGATPVDLVRETARQFGYRRTGAGIAARLEQRIEQLLVDGRLVEQSGMLLASEIAET